MAAIPMEGTGLLYGDSDPPATEFGEILNITPPGLMVEAIPTHHLKSTFKTKRMGQIPDSEDVVLRVIYDPSDAQHIAIRDLVKTHGSNDKYFSIVFNDENTTPSRVTFKGGVKSFQPDNGEDETNLEADVTISVLSLPVWEAGY